MFLCNVICVLIIPITFMIIGFLFWKNPPQKINYWMGWRTKSAMRNHETWIFANTYGGKCFFYMGLGELLVTDLVMILLWNMNQNLFAVTTTFFVVIQTLLILPCVIKVEKEIKNRFQ